MKVDGHNSPEKAACNLKGGYGKSQFCQGRTLTYGTIGVSLPRLLLYGRTDFSKFSPYRVFQGIRGRKMTEYMHQFAEANSKRYNPGSATFKVHLAPGKKRKHWRPTWAME